MNSEFINLKFTTNEKLLGYISFSISSLINITDEENWIEIKEDPLFVYSGSFQESNPSIPRALIRLVKFEKKESQKEELLPSIHEEFSIEEKGLINQIHNQIF